MEYIQKYILKCKQNVHVNDIIYRYIYEYFQDNIHAKQE